MINMTLLIQTIMDFDFKIVNEDILNKENFININTPIDYRELEELYVQGWDNNKQ